MENLKFRHAAAGDLPALTEIEEAAFRHNLISRRSFRRFIGSPTATLIVATARSSLVGYVLILFSARRHSARLYSLAVSPTHAGKGIGGALLMKAEQAVARRGLARVRLEVDESNRGARRLYAGRGYAHLRRLPSYYDNGASALLFEKDLGSIASAYGSVN